jgi:hypothetical protein
MFQFRLSTVLWTVTLWGCFLGFLRLVRVPMIPTLVICAVTLGLSVLPILIASLVSEWRSRRTIPSDESMSVPRETIDKVANDDVFHVKHPFCHNELFHVKRAECQSHPLRKSGST